MSDLLLTLLSAGFSGLVFYVLIVRPAIRARRGEPVQPLEGGPAAWSLPLPAGESPTEVLSVLEAAQHLLLIGPTRSGKTSLVHELSQRWRQRAAVVVLDPDATPGLWPGCDVHGAGDNFEAINTALAALLAELEARRQARARGVRQFAPVRVIMSEAADVMKECQAARPVFEGILRRGAKLGIGLVVDVQDRQRKTLDLDGATHLIQNFDAVCEVRKLPDGRRVAGVNGTDYPIPQLADLDKLQAAAPVLPEPAHQHTHTHTNTHTPHIDAELSLPPVCVPRSVPGDKQSAIALLAADGWTVSQVRELVKGDFKAIGQMYKEAKEGDDDEHE